MKKNVNNNFLEEEIEYVDDDSTDEFVEELVEEVEEEADEVDQASSVINEAMKRIEQANLYKALLNHQLFAPGSARPEIIVAVRREFKQFILSRLEVLLGIKPEAVQSPSKATRSDFSDEELSAMKGIARRLIEKDKASASPSVVPVNVPQPKVQALEASIRDYEAEEQAPVKRVVRRVVKKARQPESAPKTASRRKKSANLSSTGEDLSQAVAVERPPLGMPSIETMNLMALQQASSNQRNMKKFAKDID